MQSKEYQNLKETFHKETKIRKIYRKTITKHTLENKVCYKMKFGKVTYDPDSNVQNFEKEFIKTICLPGDEDNYRVVLTDSCTNAIEACIAFNYYHNLHPKDNVYHLPNQVYHSVWSGIKRGNPEAKIKFTEEKFETKYTSFNGISDDSLMQYNKEYNIKEVLKHSDFICISFSRGKIYENLKFGRGGAIIFKKNSLYLNKLLNEENDYVYSWLKRYNHNGRDSNINVNFDYFEILTAEIKKSKCIFGIPIWTTTEKVILGNKQNHIHELVEGPLKIVREMNQNKESYFDKVLQTEPNTTRYPAISDILKYQ